MAIERTVGNTVLHFPDSGRYTSDQLGKVADQINCDVQELDKNLADSIALRAAAVGINVIIRTPQQRIRPEVARECQSRGGKR